MYIKKSFVFLMMLMTGDAIAQTTYLDPGQCIIVRHRRVCATTPVIAPQGVTTIVNQTNEEITRHAYCQLTENRSPNVWQLCTIAQQGTRNNRTCFQTFAHFEGRKCLEEAEKMNK